MSSDFARLLANLIRFGTVKSVTTTPARACIEVGGLLTKPRPWVSVRAGKSVRQWSPPSVGEQVIFVSPNGDLSAGVAICGIFSDAHPIPEGATADNVLIAFGDGAVFLYDLVTHVLRGTLPEGGRVEVEAPGGFLFKGNARVEGDLDVTGKAHATGKVTSDDDVLAGAISLKNHPHEKTQPGTGVSGKPI